MGLRLTTTEGKTAMYDSTTDTAFGPIFDSEEDAENFLAWMETETGDPDVRRYTTTEICQFLTEYRRSKEVAS